MPLRNLATHFTLEGRGETCCFPGLEASTRHTTYSPEPPSPAPGTVSPVEMRAAQGRVHLGSGVQR